jgi:hypothetical protein
MLVGSSPECFRGEIGGGDGMNLAVLFFDILKMVRVPYCVKRDTEWVCIAKVMKS